MEEPSTAEMVRTLMAQLSALAASTAALREAQQSKEIARLDARATFIGRAVWTVVLGPLFVGLMVWLITRGGA